MTQLETQQPETNKATKLISLTIENVMRIKAIRLQFGPDGGLTVIGGRNAQGKTSVLKAIAMALGGKRAEVDTPINSEAKTGKVILDLNRFVVRKEWSQKSGSTLRITTKDSKQGFTSPQKLLDGLLGDLSFDPLAFVNQKPAEQVATLKDLVGLDFTEQDAERERLYDRRHLIGQQVTQLKGQLEGVDFVEDVPDEEVSISSLLKKRTEMEDQNRAHEAVREDANQKQKAFEAGSAGVERLRSELEAAEQACDTEKEFANSAHARVKALRDDYDLTEIDAKIAAAEGTNAAVRQNQGRENIRKRLIEEKGEYDGLTEQIDAIDDGKAAKIAAAQFPIDGLGFGDGTVTYKGMSLSGNASTAEQLRVSTALGLALNPELKLALIDQGEKLDPEHLKVIADMATEKGARVIMTRVSEGDECDVIIEDGEIKGGEKGSNDNG